MILPVTHLLKSKSVDICDGLQLIEPLKALFITRREDVDKSHRKWHKKALTLTEKVNIADNAKRFRDPNTEK